MKQEVWDDAIRAIQAASDNQFPIVVADAVIESLEHIISFGKCEWRPAKLVKRKTSKGNEINDDVPLGKIYLVGPSAVFLPVGERCYFMEDGGWMPVEFLELIKENG